MPDGSNTPAGGEEARAAFARDGMLFLPGFFTGAEAEAISNWTDELCAAPEVPDRHWVYWEKTLTDPPERVIQRIENFCPFHHGFDRLVRHDRLSAAVSNVLGDEALLFKEKINFKMPRAPGFTPHQDQAAGWGRYAPFFVTAMVTIDATTIENGCLEIAPGWHDRGLLGPEWKPVPDEVVAGMAMKPLPTRPGDVVLFDSFVPHQSAPNATDEPRRVLYLTYNAARHGDQRAAYYADKFAAFPPDVARKPGDTYVFRV
jgi:hypothetical protein